MGVLERKFFLWFVDGVGGAGSVHESVEKARQTQPDIVLMDFLLPDGSGLDATRAILAVQPGCKIVFLTVNESDQILFAALRAGRVIFCSKTCTALIFCPACAGWNAKSWRFRAR